MKTDKKMSVEREQPIGLEREAWKNINRMGYEEKGGKVSLFLAKTPTSALVFGNLDLKVIERQEKDLTRFVNSGH